MPRQYFAASSPNDCPSPQNQSTLSTSFFLFLFLLAQNVPPPRFRPSSALSNLSLAVDSTNCRRVFSSFFPGISCLSTHRISSQGSAFMPKDPIEEALLILLILEETLKRTKQSDGANVLFATNHRILAFVSLFLSLSSHSLT